MRLFLLLSFTALMLVEAYKFNDETDKQALLEFKSKVSEGRRSVLSSWNNSSPLCNWTGVKCGRKHKRVTGLDLGGLQLGGTISPSIGNLSFLTSLNLENNSFGGTIPQEVGNLFRIQHLLMSLNFLEGGIPTKLGSLTKLAYLELGKNNLKGKIPASLGNLTSLKYLSFGSNYIKGGIPNDISRLTQVLYLDLSMNHFSGVFPPGIYNLSLLESFNIFGNGFSGSLRPDFGNLLPNIRELYVGSNHLTGLIPTTLPNISNLQMLGMEFNSLTGSIPSSFGNVQYLQTLELNNNSLGSYSAGDLDFLGALTNCTQLDVLTVSENVLGGILPTSIANISIYVTELSLGWNLISGSIPHDIGNIINLQTLLLANNLLSGRLPASLGKLSNLGLLSVSSNRMSGEIPFSIGNITRLEKLYLDKNSFEGTIPPSLGNCSYMLRLRMDHNTLTGTIPREIMQISPLVFLTMSNNYLTGSLPKDVGSLEHLGTLSVAYNKLSGELPQTLGKCLLMEQLYLQVNSFDGTIPDISGLVGVKEVDFSNNNLSGSIPRYLANFNSLEHLNLSINNFEGKVPTEGKFKNATIVSVFGNKNLCGGVLELKLSSCLSQELEKRAKHSSLSKKVVIGVCIGGSIFIILFIASVSLCWFKNRKKNKTNAATPSTFGTFLEQISYGDLRNATDGFSSSSLIGSGSFGAVFKALLPAQNKVVAVKVLNMQRRGAMKSFMAECESLKDVRHRNLVKLLTACSSIDYQGNQFRALIYEFMPNGSLDMWLHPEEPSNVLLDNDLTAHVSDFGLARILLKLDQEYFLNQLSSAGVRGTIGYAAPEYGLGGQISTHGDVYSFGILVLEMFSGKRPTNEVFGENFTLCSYVKSALPERVLEVADEFILHSGLRIGFPAAKCLTLVFEVGLRCCEESPMSRLAMSEAVKELISIRESFFRSRRRAGR
ncbi:BnaA09g53520D [Brassica napus]|uniref:non-specific serine/threonine protein kinase n=1 Tax=Brassica napus TaxID=3708 RepID=A0A078JKD7_BRANA|nr:BnaA09g53520D [Brassica napus]